MGGCVQAHALQDGTVHRGSNRRSEKPESGQASGSRRGRGARDGTSTDLAPCRRQGPEAGRGRVDDDRLPRRGSGVATARRRVGPV
ncbi:hypothetical protein ISF6_2329 [Piscinibacter sakaiensis]|uniref:Uncharacterized protein n=1 Tax=Piscinibacter sakaiensis TaxID=1547922 RepID=A0A0K8P1S4_PISS1|nr:hypothetical protein ISF6_2329 [Piscinibacter sakaiensis]